MSRRKGGDWRLEPGEVLGSWRIVEPLGRGGMGEVYVAEHVLIEGRKAAVKVLQPHREVDESFRGRFFEEVAVHSKIDSPHVVKLFDANVTADGVAWMALELLRGKPLDDVLVAHVRLAAADALTIAAQMAEGLYAVHLLGALHRDVKPANVFLTREGSVKVLDLGTTKIIGGDLRRQRPSTDVGAVIGTMSFMSPEQLLGERVGPRCDIFSLAIVLYYLLTGRHCFDGSTDGFVAPMLLTVHIAKDDPFPPEHHGVEVPPPVWAFIAEMLQKDPSHRPPSMAHVASRARALAAALGAEPTHSLAHLLEPVPRPERPRHAERSAALDPAPSAVPPTSATATTTPIAPAAALAAAASAAPQGRPTSAADASTATVAPLAAGPSPVWHGVAEDAPGRDPSPSPAAWVGAAEPHRVPHRPSGTLPMQPMPDEVRAYQRKGAPEPAPALPSPEPEKPPPAAAPRAAMRAEVRGQAAAPAAEFPEHLVRLARERMAEQARAGASAGARPAVGTSAPLEVAAPAPGEGREPRRLPRWLLVAFVIASAWAVFGIAWRLNQGASVAGPAEPPAAGTAIAAPGLEAATGRAAAAAPTLASAAPAQPPSPAATGSASAAVASATALPATSGPPAPAGPPATRRPTAPPATTKNTDDMYEGL